MILRTVMALFRSAGIKPPTIKDLEHISEQHKLDVTTAEIEQYKGIVSFIAIVIPFQGNHVTMHNYIFKRKGELLYNVINNSSCPSGNNSVFGLHLYLLVLSGGVYYKNHKFICKTFKNL